MAAKVISKPQEPVEPVFKIYGKGGGWFTAAEVVGRFAEYDFGEVSLPWTFGSLSEHPRIQEELQKFKERKDRERAEAPARAQEQRRLEAKAKWDRNKKEAARRMRK